MEHGAADVNGASRDAVAIIGGGWAGCAAAVALARRGVRVELFEAAAVLGGRARRVDRDGLAIDNGQHLLLGAYADCLALIGELHERRAPVIRMPLTVAPLATRRADALALTARAWRAPFGLLAGLAAARGIGFAERVATIAWFTRLARGGFRCPPGQTVAQLLAALPRRAARALWAPLCVAALNTPPERASAAAFATVLQLAFASDAGASDFVVPATDLSSIFPDAAARHVAAHGGRVVAGARVRIESIDADGVTLSDRARSWKASGAIVAVGPHQLADAFARRVALECAPVAEAIGACARLDYEPIATVYLGYHDAVALPSRIVRLDDSPGQWLFDRRDVLTRSDHPPARVAHVVAVVISASGPHDALDRDALVHACDTQLRRLRPGLPELVWSQAIVERRATYACTPDRPRPPHVQLAANVVLAGDYVHPTLPATLEAAVQTGIAAARAMSAAR